MSVIIETSIGDFTIDLYTEERPRCCMNFLKLCKIKYYNFSLFYSVQSNLVAQTGDPTATGRGGESIYAQMYGEQARFFDMEVSPRIKHVKKGLISMVNNGSGMHGSQFFITLAESLDYLDGKHTVFGEVAEGFDIIDKLNNTFCGEDNRPHQDIRIYHTIILDDPYDDPDGLVVPCESPGPTKEMLNSDHIPCDADLEEDKGKSVAELAEIAAEKEAKANTQLLEMVGDLPDADVAPPENVLFVCKLNPVTTSEDLEIIFSRFGVIVSCDVIKDNKTGESLQYAFIEFDNPQSCENAYFKMDNVLIDDRRIHVDFSQSVSKLKWKGKGKGVEILNSGDAPVYVLKNQQRRDNNYDLVYEEDLPTSKNTDKSKLYKERGSPRREQQRGSPRRERQRGSPRREQQRGDSDKSKARNGTLQGRKLEKSGDYREDRREHRDDSRRETEKSPRGRQQNEDSRRERARSPVAKERRDDNRRERERSPIGREHRDDNRRERERSPIGREHRGINRRDRDNSPWKKDYRVDERRERERTPDRRDYRIYKERRRDGKSPMQERQDRREGYEKGKSRMEYSDEKDSYKKRQRHDWEDEERDFESQRNVNARKARHGDMGKRYIRDKERSESQEKTYKKGRPSTQVKGRQPSSEGSESDSSVQEARKEKRKKKKRKNTSSGEGSADDILRNKNKKSKKSKKKHKKRDMSESE